MDTLLIKGTQVQATSPEGQTAKISIEDWLARVAPARMDTGDAILPDGVKAVLSRGVATLWFPQSPPRTYGFKWIARDSPVRFGNGTQYRQVRIALPYLIVMAVFAPGENGLPQLSLQHNEAFFRNAPMESLDDEICFPALLNCSRLDPPQGRPLSWICTQHLPRQSLVKEKDTSRRLRAGLRALLHCLLEIGFNDSSEQHEASSWFSESRRVDPRLATVEDWEAASAADPSSCSMCPGSRPA